MSKATSNPAKTDPTPETDVWEEQAKANLENWKRTAAELENLTKRAQQAREQYTRFATRELILDLLPVVDNFDRALAHVPAEQNGNDWLVGVTYIHKQLLEVLERNGVTVVEIKVGDQFDPATMHATSSEASEQPKDAVLTVMNQAYKLNNEVIRPANVTVSAGSK